MDLDKYFAELYQQDPTHAAGLDKTAEARMIEELQGTGHVANPLADMSLEQLQALEHQLTKQASAQPSQPQAAGTGDDENLEKVAFEMLGGEVMAHAAVHELELIKVAVASGRCRVCKEHPLDVQGSSICSACQE